MKHWGLLILALVMALMVAGVPVVCVAEGISGADAASGGIDWTGIAVAAIGLISAVVSTLGAWAWKTHIKPWLDARNLTDAAMVVVEAVEAIFGRYMGAEKWKAAIEKMAARGFYTDSELVIDALRAAWKALDLKQLAAGEKDAPSGAGGADDGSGGSGGSGLDDGAPGAVGD